MDLLDRLATREDFHQSTEYATVMEKIAWSSIPVDGSRVAVRSLGPIAISKMQRPQVINLAKIRAIRRKLHVIRFIVEPTVVSTLIDLDGKEHTLSFKTADDTQKGIQLLKKAGLRVTSEHYAHSKTALLDIQNSLDSVIHSLPSKTRYNIKVSMRSNVVYTFTPFADVSFQQKKDFFSLHERWSNDKKVHGFTNSFLDTVMQSFPQTGWLISAHIGDDFLGAMMVLIHDRIGYYFYTCSSEKGKRLHVPTGLTYQALCLSKEQGADIFDFCSVYDERYPQEHPRWKGFTTFKERFHPVSLYYPPTFARWF